MNKSFIACLFIAQIAFSSAVFLKKPVNSHSAVFSQLRDISDSDFGKRILDTIAIQLKNKSPLSDVAKMLADIRNNLVMQQHEDDSVQAARIVECKETIAALDATINTCQANADDAAEQIGVLNSEIKALEIKVNSLNNQLEILNSRSVSLALAREQDHKDYEARQAQAPLVADALDLIVEKLKTITPTSVDGAFAELAKIGKSNPIAALLQVASTFSLETLQGVIKKMEDLKVAVLAAAEADVEAEAAAAAQYKKLVGEIAGTVKHVTAARNEAASTKQQKEASLAIQQKRLAENTHCVEVNQAKKVAKIQQCANWAAKYAEDKENRAEEIEVIKTVENIVATKLDTMKDYLKDAANAE